MSNEFWYGVVAGFGALGWLVILVAFLAAVAQHRAKSREGRK